MRHLSSPNRTGPRFRASSFDRWILREIGARVAQTSAAVRFGDGAPAGFAGGSPIATLTIRDGGTLRRLALNPAMELGDAYTDGRIEIDGDLVGFLEAVFRLEKNESVPARLASSWLKLVQNNSLRGSRDHIHHHYDLGNDFYKLWLDSRMVYTCAYFPQPTISLEEAQLAKMDHVCRKLQLRPGERVVEAGCGWGSLALHMAREFGANVRAFNISKEQIAYAREQARAAGLHNQVEFVEDDYRNISGQYDAFVSVGMLEHVGKNHHGEFAEVIRRSIGKSGRGLLHFIGRNQPTQLNAWIRKRIFPGGYPPTIRESIGLLEPLDMAVCDVENLRQHYAWTLEHWLARFEKSSARVAEMFGEPFVRMWRLYLAGSIAGFRSGSMQLFQLLFAGADCTAIPVTRDHLYAKTASANQERKWLHASA
ncbi:MAG TPA: cyclopropane-fatty-acyl-phospholipid synthase family protein [Candidatus Acidoferrum sp.]|nr:cyclopropane-fatty-acyl-phospholipid synthase family protein [Candidatus Acidoferrum sp.]